MHININSDNHVELNEQSVQQWSSEITASLKRFSDWITRIEVHLTDVNSAAKTGPEDIRCVLEARPAGRQPVSVEVRGATVEHAIQDGIETLQRRLGTIADKARSDKRNR